VTIRIFVADDHQVVRDGIISLLETAGDMTVVGTGSTGADALQQVPSLDPDVVLVDIRLPDMNGVELVRRLRVASPRATLIVLTVYDDDEVLLAALDAGARGYFLKDIRGDELIASIRAVHAGDRRISGILLDHVLELLARVPDSDTPTLDLEDIQIVRGLAEGKTNPESAAEQYMSLPTLKRRLRRIFAKLGAKDRTQAVAEAARRNLL